MIQNIVASTGLHKRIDVEIVADILDDVMYKPEQFSGLMLKEPKTVLLLFASGKLVCTGRLMFKQVSPGIWTCLHHVMVVRQSMGPIWVLASCHTGMKCFKTI